MTLLTCSYATSYADFKAAQRLARKSKRSWAVRWVLMAYVAPVVGVLAVVLFLRNLTGPRTPAGPALSGMYAVFIFFGVYYPLMLLWCQRRAFKRGKGTRGPDDPVELELTPAELISRVPGRSEGRFLPASLLRFVEDERMALIYVSPQHFLYLPKSAMGQTEWNLMREWMQTHGVRIGC